MKRLQTDRNRHIYRGMQCRWLQKFPWTFGVGEIKSAHIIHEAIGHFQTSFETFFALEINATIHTVQLFACYFLIIDYINVNLALKMPYRCKSWIIKINVVIVKESVLSVVKTICMDILGNSACIFIRGLLINLGQHNRPWIYHDPKDKFYLNEVLNKTIYSKLCFVLYIYLVQVNQEVELIMSGLK